MKDYTKFLKQKNLKYYGGANGNKKSIILEDGTTWMMKFPSTGNAKNFEMHYTNSAISEYICCHIYNLLKVKAQDTMLGTVFDNNKEKLVVLCRDMEEQYNARLYSFAEVKNENTGSSSNGMGTELTDILETIKTQEAINSDEMELFFWKMIVVDALIGNFDRHNGNWGILVGTDGASIAPIYDCGSSLYAQISDRQIETVLKNKGEINSRIFNFPKSAIKNESGEKYSYKNILELDYPFLKKAIKEMKPTIDRAMPAIYKIIDGMECISDIRKKFYKTMLTQRKEKLIDASYRKYFEKAKNRNAFKEEEREL